MRGVIVMAEYSTVSMNVDFKSGIDGASGDQITQRVTSELTPIVKKASRTCETLQGGGWDIVSHHFLRIGNYLVVSFLLHRQ
jgi:hypothetical protein